jgi:hypothetical protein
VASLGVRQVPDEAETLAGASLMLRDLAEWLLELERDGWQLVGASTVATASWSTKTPKRGSTSPLDKALRALA